MQQSNELPTHWAIFVMERKTTTTRRLLEIVHPLHCCSIEQEDKEAGIK
jgi:hypothetical protein